MGKSSPKKGNMQIISRQSFPIGRAITAEHAKLVNGLASQNWSPEELSDAVKNLQAVRRDAQSWGKAQIEAIILNSARENGMQALSMASLKELHANDPSPHFAAQLFCCTRGWFDNNPRWEYNLETQYMHMLQMVYCETEEGKKGCFARLFCEVRKEIIKSVNRVGRGSHGGTIRIKRTKEEVEEGGKGKGREKGETLCGFFVGHGRMH